MSSQLPARSAWAKGPPAKAPGAPSPQARPSPPSTTTTPASATHVADVPSTLIPVPTSPSHHASPLIRIQQGVSPIGLPCYPGMLIDPSYSPYRTPQWVPQHFPPHYLSQGPLGTPTPALSTSPLRGKQPPVHSSRTKVQPPMPQDLSRSGPGAPGFNLGANTLAPKRVTIKSESGKVLDLEEYRKQVPPRVHPSVSGTEEARRARLAAKKMARKNRQKAEKAKLGAEERILDNTERQIIRSEIDQAMWEAEGARGTSREGEWESWERKDEGGDGATAVREAEQQVSAVPATASAEEAEIDIPIELPRAEIQDLQRAPVVDEEMNEKHDAVSELKMPLRSEFTSVKAKHGPAPLVLQERDLVDLEVGRSALAHARPIEDIGQVQYPEGVSGPKADLNANAAPGRFRYDPDFLLQFMSVCKDRPDALPSLDEISIISADQTLTGRGPHDSRSSARAPSCQPFAKHGTGPLAFRKFTTNPLAVLDSDTTLPSRPPSKAQRPGDLSQFGKLAKCTWPSSLWNQGDKLESPESMNAGEGSVDMVSGSSERLAPVLTVTHPSPAQETEDHLDPLPTCRTRAKRGGAQKKGKLVSCKTDLLVEDDSDDTFKDVFQDLIIAQEELPRWSCSGPRRMSDEEANERMNRTITTLSGLHNITTVFAIFGDLPARYHGRLVDRLVSCAIECNADAHAQMIAYFLHCAAERGLCSPTAFEDGVSMTASALGSITEENPNAISRYAAVIQGIGIHEDPSWHARVMEKAGIHGPALELKLSSI